MDESLAGAWESQAEAWARWVRAPDGDPWSTRFNWPAFAAIVPEAGRLTVDLGCGEGRVGRALRERGHRVVGVDAAPTMVARARETGAYGAVHVAPASASRRPDTEAVRAVPSLAKALTRPPFLHWRAVRER